MPPPASVPSLADWLAAMARGLHPARWGLAALALAATALCAALAEAWLSWEAPRWEAWLRQPAEQAETLILAAAARSPATAALRLAVPLMLCAGAWCLAGGWIARHELLARRAARGDPQSLWPAVGPTALILSRARALLLCCALPIILILVLLIPVVIAGRVNDWMGGPGALIVSVLYPLVWLSGLLLVVLALGAAGWPLMPVAIAAEMSDEFDAVSRSYSYFYQRLFECALLTAVALALGALPLAALLGPLAETAAGWSEGGRSAAWYLAAAVGASAFWSLETVVYLHLRARVDAVEVGELAAAPAAEQAAAPPKPPPAAAGAPLRGAVLALAGLAGAWFLTAWLFDRSGGPQAGWAGWGLAEGFVPPAEGMYKVASVIAGLWGALGLGLAVLVALRRVARGPEHDKGDRK